MYRWDYDVQTALGIDPMCKNPLAEYNRRIAAQQRIDNTIAIASSTAANTSKKSTKISYIYKIKINIYSAVFQEIMIPKSTQHQQQAEVNALLQHRIIELLHKKKTM